MRLELNGLSVCCIIGDRPDERERLQELRLDLSLEISDRAADSDHLSDTVDYVALADSVRGALIAARCQMIERAAKIAAERCLAFEGVRSARIRVTKKGAIDGLESASSIYEGKCE